MDINTSKLVLAAAGGSASDSVYVDDVFSTFLYDGNGGTKTITNGIDNTEKSLVWIKCRNLNYENHMLFDTERGVGNFIKTNSDSPQNSTNNAVTAFNSDGFTTGDNGATNNGSGEYVSWNFKAQKGFFDIVEYSGTGSAQNIAHSLGSTPGMILIRCLIGTHDWEVYHRSTGPTVSLHINQPDAANSDSSVWNNTAPTSTQFTVGTNNNVNQNGHTYIAYIFAHDDAQFGTNEDESIIKCGSYTGNGSTDGPEINLGFEAQWIMIKRTDTSSDWYMFDNMRGMVVGGDQAYFEVNSSIDESTARFHDITSTGWKIVKSWDINNAYGGTYIYMAIRRPNKPPESATEVFNLTTTNNDANYTNAGFPVDFGLTCNTNHTYGNILGTRLTGKNYLYTASTSWRDPSGYADTWTSNTSFRFVYAGSGYNWVNFAFKRAPGFVDVLVYDGDGDANRVVAHNLEEKPEMVIIKNTSYSSGTNWTVWHKDIFNTQLALNNNDAWANSGPTSAYGGSGSGTSTGAALMTSTSSHISPGNAFSENASGEKYTALLFATLPGISKVSSYTGNGSSQYIDCGFTNGARFVLIRRVESAGHWYLWDTARGITMGDDYYTELNNNDTQYTENSNDLLTHGSGFGVNHGGATDININGATYIFLAIA